MTILATFKNKPHITVPNSHYIKADGEVGTTDTQPSVQPVKPAQPEAE